MTLHLNMSSLFDKKLDQANSTKPEQVSSLVKQVIVEQKIDDKQCESREQNIIIHRVKESTSAESDERIEHDKQYVQRLCAEPLELGKMNIKNTIRLGKKPDDGKSRPLKVVFNSKEDKKKVMTRLGKLKDAEQEFKQISITDDLSKEEQDLIRKKVLEAKELEKNANEGGLWKYRVRGPPWNLRIQKVPAETGENLPLSNV